MNIDMIVYCSCVQPDMVWSSPGAIRSEADQPEMKGEYTHHHQTSWWEFTCPLCSHKITIVADVS